MHKILAIRLYFPLDALHVSDCISPSSGATFIDCTSHLVYAGTLVYLVGLYTYCKMMHGAYSIKLVIKLSWVTVETYLLHGAEPFLRS